MNKFRINYRTSTKKIYPIEIGYKLVRLDQMVYEPVHIRTLCKTGCKNYNQAGGCPPRSPLLEEITKDVQSVFLIYGTFWPEYKSQAVKNSSSMYVHFRLQDIVLSNMIHTIGLDIRHKHNTIFLGTGFCMGCKGKKCNYKMGLEYCANPSKRTYSMESTGINVSETLLNTVGIKLQWYKKGENFDIPLTKCGVVMFKNEITEEDFHKIFSEVLNSKYQFENK